MSRTAIAWLVCMLASCGVPEEVAAPEEELAWFRVELPAAADPDSLSWEPTLEAVRDVHEGSPYQRRLAFRPSELPERLIVSAAGACSSELSIEDPTARLAPWIAVHAELPVGFGRRFALEVEPGCAEAVAGRIAWRHISGPELTESSEERRGFLYRARSPARTAIVSDPLPWGVVPISARTFTVLEARWTGASAPPAVVRVYVRAADRATGLASVPLGHRILLGGTGWSILDRPPGAENAQLDNGNRYGNWLLVSAPGEWRLEDASQRELLLRVGRFDETPLDCGRTECHASAGTGAFESPMTSALARRLPVERNTCAEVCHVVGEAGAPDGGFAHVARELGLSAVTTRTFDTLPTSLQRLGGVGCTACHGPGAIPAPESRWAILRSDVCATCHDAPPRYGHVAAWRSSSMSRSDRDPRTREPECARCHTTTGFLTSIGVAPTRQLPDDTPIGIACAACHAPHAEETAPSLVRRVNAPSSQEPSSPEPSSPEPSRICVACHAGGEQEENALPMTTSFALFHADEGVHRDVERGCIGCHMAASEGATRGGGHSFVANESACASCHDEEDVLARTAREGTALRQRVETLWGLLQARGHVRGVGHHAVRPTVASDDETIRQAARDTWRVLADPGAYAHAPATTIALVESAEQTLIP